jgi:hypothetical protein
MAFDRPDTDRLYDRVIRPVLRANAIIPVIINRRQSNQDLNNQIVEQLESCDFCIADLTYTRPSVYFEAGYAQRVMPVIYTVRADHLGRNQPDDLRVHFDLQMKPLIRWRQPLDPDFRASLVRRLRSTVLRDWARAQKAISVRNDNRKAFASESVSHRLAVMRQEAMLGFRRFGFRRWAPHGNSGEPSPQIQDMAKIPYPLVSQSITKGESRTACVVALESVTATALRDLHQRIGFLRYFGTRPPTVEPIQTVRLHIVCMSLRPAPASRIEKEFDYFARGDREGRFVHERSVTGDRSAQSTTSIPFLTTLDVLDEVRSFTELRTELRALMAASFGDRPNER